ncbi:pectate lyase [Streptomyces sp. NPDC048584]|uniref:pectate lyase n=1 Tax=Streptomyces sp. NPDC048584 TaxID=3365573 RepID=UPI00371688D6
MTARPGQRVSHRCGSAKRRATTAGLSALGLTGAAIVTTPMPSTAGAATSSWPSDTGSRTVSETVPVSGTYDGGMKKFYGTGDLGGDGQDGGRDPVLELADGESVSPVRWR